MVIDLSGKVCLVTGASRGLGKGIAVQLAVHGAQCYVTGRNGDLMQELNKEVENSGGSGTCIPLQCNHENDEQVENVFRQIREQNNGQLDLLVNNVYSAVNHIISNMNCKFWEQSDDTWDIINNVGLRNHYLCSTYAARMMVKNKTGVIINISSIGGILYLFSAAYGIGKAANERMARDCSLELRSHGIAFVSLMPGLVRTELMRKGIEDGIWTKLGPYAQKAETPTYVGRTVVALMSESKVELMSKTGKTLLTTDIGRRYCITDETGAIPPSMFQLNYVLYSCGYRTLSKFIPDCVRIPMFLVKFIEVLKTS